MMENEERKTEIATLQVENQELKDRMATLEVIYSFQL